MESEVDFESEGWAKKVADSKSNVEEEPAVLEVKRLREEVDQLKELLENLNKNLTKNASEASLI